MKVYMVPVQEYHAWIRMMMAVVDVLSEAKGIDEANALKLVETLADVVRCSGEAFESEEVRKRARRRPVRKSVRVD